jgi:hypothetical protein
MRILVADDEPEMVMVLEALLKREHYSVDAVYNGQDALDYGLGGNYACIVLDIMMPKLDGIQVLQALRAKQTATPVLLLTAKSQVEDRVAGLDNGADDYLPKPFDSRGYVDHYRFGLFPSEDGGSTMIVMECFLMLQAADNMLLITVLIFLVCALIVFLLLLFFSGRAIRPFAENLERQRQFVTDASHELKTPLSILSADLDLLSNPCGESRWLESARTQIARLDRLIKDLVELARTEERIEGDTVEEFSVTEIAQASVDAFQPAAEADGKTLVSEIGADINTKGVRDNFFCLFSILLDNAVKYCDPEGTIRLSLSQHGKNIYISVSDPCKGIDTAQLSRYFDRFYRVDPSRSRSTGGYGIGLSTAKAIVIRHHGHIANSYADGVITFTAKIPKTC